jgi:hypothetical protein
MAVVLLAKPGPKKELRKNEKCSWEVNFCLSLPFLCIRMIVRNCTGERLLFIVIHCRCHFGRVPLVQEPTQSHECIHTGEYGVFPPDNISPDTPLKQKFPKFIDIFGSWDYLNPTRPCA